ncbi:hypothetical protein HDV03_003421 [Kappamyces sp. JEL0829]|nr:hypothetical protein HDV03_003421 [Kappamyces sp. JEL0829]
MLKPFTKLIVGAGSKPKLPKTKFYLDIVKKGYSVHGLKPEAIQREFLPAFSVQSIREVLSLLQTKRPSKLYFTLEEDLLLTKFLRDSETKEKATQNDLLVLGVTELGRSHRSMLSRVSRLKLLKEEIRQQALDKGKSLSPAELWDAMLDHIQSRIAQSKSRLALHHLPLFHSALLKGIQQFGLDPNRIHEHQMPTTNPATIKNVLHPFRPGDGWDKKSMLALKNLIKKDVFHGDFERMHRLVFPGIPEAPIRQSIEAIHAKARLDIEIVEKYYNAKRKSLDITSAAKDIGSNSAKVKAIWDNITAETGFCSSRDTATELLEKLRAKAHSIERYLQQPHASDHRLAE